MEENKQALENAKRKNKEIKIQYISPKIGKSKEMSKFYRMLTRLENKSDKESVHTQEFDELE